MTLARSSIVGGPAIVQFKEQTIYVAGDIVATPLLPVKEIVTAVHGPVRTIRDSMLFQLQFRPSGQVIAGHLDVLWPYASTAKGTSIFGAADSDIVIHTIAGQTVTYYAAAVTAPPDLVFSAVEPFVAGNMTMQCLGTDDTEWSDESKRLATEAEAFADTSFDPDHVKTVPYTVTWGDAPWADVETEAGVRVSCRPSFRDERTDRGGIVDRKFQAATVQARFIPAGISESQWATAMALQGAGVLRGSSVRNTDDLVVTGGASNLIFTMYDASPVDGSLVFGDAKRTGEMVLQGLRRVTTGAIQPLWAMAINAAE